MMFENFIKKNKLLSEGFKTRVSSCKKGMEVWLRIYKRNFFTMQGDDNDNPAT